ncbi:MAG: AbrB/MazE/SpoVT family DNA-binding domain-containing protein [Candidatus Omnitrophica bacterium]|nr:AbrB/MazE/SpoVT family DNA-binding domain-containing protein [Candidatus Omnitrophota bacterium]
MISTKATTKLSSKGQVVIPESIRETLRLKTGDVFLVYGKDDTIVFKAAPPADDEFEAIVSDFENFAKKAHLKPSDINNTIKKVRTRR